MMGDDDDIRRSAQAMGRTGADAKHTWSNRSEKTDRIGRHLKDVYDETVREPIPDDLVKLLKKLDSGNDSQ